MNTASAPWMVPAALLPRPLLTAALVFGIGSSGPAAALLRNGSFEADGRDIVGVGYLRQGNALSGWEARGDGEAARNTAGVGFYDNGLCPDGAVVLALQNRTDLVQEVGPFEADRVYRLRLRANGRASDVVAYGQCGLLDVRLNGTVLLGPVRVHPVEASGQHATPFALHEALFSTGGGSLRLELRQLDAANGISVLVDDVRIEPADAVTGAVTAVNRARLRPHGEPVTGVDFRRAQWIWSPEEGNPREAAPPGTRWFRRAFHLPAGEPVRRALLVGAADNHADVFINGVCRGRLGGFSEWYEIDFTADLLPGRNLVAVEAANAGRDPNPAGWVGMLLFYTGDGTVSAAIPTDRDWRARRTPAVGWETLDADDAGWEAAMVVGPLGSPPWGDFGFLTWLVPADFPAFRVPGHEADTDRLRRLFWLHYPQSGPLATLWDGWMSLSSLWPATGEAPGANTRRERWRRALLARRIDGEGYVSTHQHHGFGHGEGWPFPTYAQGGAVGWVFQTSHLAYRMPWTGKTAEWQLAGLRSESLTRDEGWQLVVTEGDASLTTPAFDIDHGVSPLLRLEWQADCPPGAVATVEWATAAAPDFSAANSLPLPLIPDAPGGHYTHVHLYRHGGWQGRLTRFRLSFRNAAGGRLRLQSLCAVTDTRHTVNNACFLQGCTEYVNWTGDVGFLGENLPRMRAALGYALREFRVDQEGCVFPPWVGHEGTSGIAFGPDGTKTVRHGRGIGGNYWDLLPFGGRDCLATIYLFDAVRRMAALEAHLAARPGWGLPAPPPELTADRLAAVARRLATEGQRRFWNADTGRFVASIDAEGTPHDYGYTFVNCEAVCYGFAAPWQAQAILDWLSGRRVVDGDTSTGEDIYHFRFGPRASTRRNVEWYTFVWSNPETIPWGGQVQDGGAVLGFAHHDHMARLLHSGADDAWAALRRTLDWFGDVQEAGGYRPYYAVPGRGTLQGGGTAGGLGMDHEFFESILVPQIMLYGFLGFGVQPDGFRLDPRLPSGWPSLEIDRIHFRNTVLTIKAEPRRVQVRCAGGADETVSLHLPPGWRLQDGRPAGPSGIPVVLGNGRTVDCLGGD